MSLVVGTQTESGLGGTGAQPVGATVQTVKEGKLLTVAEVADLLRINKSTVYRMAKQGRLPATRVGRQWRFRKSVLDGLLEPS